MWSDLFKNLGLKSNTETIVWDRIRTCQTTAIYVSCQATRIYSFSVKDFVNFPNMRRNCKFVWNLLFWRRTVRHSQYGLLTHNQSISSLTICFNLLKSSFWWLFCFLYCLYYLLNLFIGNVTIKVFEYCKRKMNESF